MKLELEFSHVDHAGNRVTLKPINGTLKGELIYNLPRRAVEACHVGDIVEASIPLPDQYPINDGMNEYLDHPLRHRAPAEKEGAWPSFNRVQETLSTILVHFPETKYFGSLGGLQDAIGGVSAVLNGFKNAVAPKAGSLVQYALSFQEMAVSQGAPYYGDGRLGELAAELVRWSRETLTRAKLKPWKTMVG